MLPRLTLLALLLLAVPAAAQDVPAVGAPATLDVATWNVEWFGSTSNGPDDDAAQLRDVAEVIRASEVDLWALQEIADAGAFNRLLVSLGDGFGGVLATESGQQRVGFVYRTETIGVRSVEHILETFDYVFAGRPPLQLEANVTLPDTTLAATFVVVHMKAFSDRESYTRRVEAARRLKNRFDVFETSTPLLLLGDFNDEVLRSTYVNQPSPYAPFVEDADDYTVLTLPIEEANQGTFCSNAACTGGSTIDHVVATDELARAYVAGSAARYEALLSAFSDYDDRVSDHLPVLARFAWGTAVSSERPASPAPAPGPYPNPFTDRLTVPYHLDRPGTVTLVAVDLLGRTVATWPLGRRPAGAYAAEIAVPGPPGIYLVQTVTEAGVTTQRVVKRGR